MKTGLEYLSDEQLAVKIRKHDISASTEFYNRHKQGVYHYCLRLLQNVQSAEDAVQNTFIKFLDGIDNLLNPSSAKSWLYAIARNEVYSTLRKNRSNGSIDEVEIIDDETPQDKFIREENVELVQRLLGQLKEEHHEVLYLLEYERMSYSEIAEITGASLNNVASRIFRARQELSKKLIPYLK